MTSPTARCPHLPGRDPLHRRATRQGPGGAGRRDTGLAERKRRLTCCLRAREARQRFSRRLRRGDRRSHRARAAGDDPRLRGPAAGQFTPPDTVSAVRWICDPADPSWTSGLAVRPLGRSRRLDRRDVDGARSGSGDGHPVDLRWVLGPVLRPRGERGDRIDHLHPLGDPPEDRVAVGQPVVLVHDEELAAVGVGSGVGHRHRAPGVLPGPSSSSRNLYPGPPLPVPVGSPPWIMKPGMTRWKITPS